MYVKRLTSQWSLKPLTSKFFLPLHSMDLNCTYTCTCRYTNKQYTAVVQSYKRQNYIVQGTFKVNTCDHDNSKPKVHQVYGVTSLVRISCFQAINIHSFCLYGDF